MSVDLLVVNPGASHGIYGPLGDDLIAVEPPLWCRLLAAYARRDNGYSVKILDAEALRVGAKEAAAKAVNMNPQLVCVAVYGHQPSASTQQMWGAGEFCREFYRLRSNTPIIIVGGHPSALPRETMATEVCDYVGVGEGPLTIQGLLEGRDEEEIPGLVWEDDDSKIHINKSAPLLSCDQLKGDAWDMLPMDRYRAHNWQCFGGMEKRYPYASIYTSLGCPYKCSFCCINAPFDSNVYRTRNADDVVAEIKMLYEDYRVETFKITDEMFVLKPSHYLAICEGLAKAGLGDKINIWAYARVDTVQPDKLKTLRRAGIRWLALGIESGSEHVRDGAEKHLRQNDIIGTVKAVQEAGINVIGNFMFGLRDDDERTMQATLDLALQCLPDFANFYSTMAYPGSGLYTQAIKNGWKLPDTWRGYSQHNDDCRPLDTEYVSGREVLQYRDHAFRAFFGNSRYLAHVKRKFGEASEEHVRKMLGYTLKRKLLEGKVA
jgi:radical SAM superfamily enzyme YgiQ (UPF0313 family)